VRRTQFTSPAKLKSESNDRQALKRPGKTIQQIY